MWSYVFPNFHFIFLGGHAYIGHTFLPVTVNQDLLECALLYARAEDTCRTVRARVRQAPPCETYGWRMEALWKGRRKCWNLGC